MKKRFKPTPFNLSETELDDLKHGFDHCFRKALQANNISAAAAWCDALQMLGTARQESFERRSNARAASRKYRSHLSLINHQS